MNVGRPLALVLLATGLAGCRREQADLVRPVSGELAAFPGLARVAPPAPADLVDLAGRSDGAEAWAVGGRVILHLVGRQWHADTLSADAPFEWSSVAFSDDATVGFAVGARGWIAQYAGGHRWTVRQETSAMRMLTSVWLDPFGRHGFAVGRNGLVLRWSDGRWSDFPLSPTRAAGILLDVAATEHELWVRDSVQVSIYGRSDGRWVRDLPRFRASRLWAQHGNPDIWVAGVRDSSTREDMYTIMSFGARDVTDTIKQIPVMPRAAWLSAQPRCGIVAGREPKGKEFVPVSVYVMPTGSRAWANPDSADIRAVWTNRECTQGWAVGSGGFVGRLSVQRLTIRGMKEEFGSVERLNGVYTLELDSGVPRPTVDSLALLEGESAIRLVSPTHFAVSYPSSRTLQIEINKVGRGAAAPLKGKQLRLRFYLSYPVAFPRYPVAYDKAGSFIYDGRTFWGRNWKWIVPAAIALVMIMIGRAGLLRRLIFTDSGQRALSHSRAGAVPAWTIFLLESVARFRWYFFRGYRKRLVEDHQGGRYPSDAELLGCDGVPPADGQLPPAALCRHAFGHVLSQRNSVLWVEDRDGTQARALLSRWVGEAVRHGRTPVYLNLRDLRPFDAQIRAAWSLLGDIPEGVPELWKSGGFLFLLDGTRGENNAEATNAFIQDERGRNVIVICRRTPPDIDGVCHLRIDPLQAG